MRIFKDLDMVEQLGSGIPRILRIYPKGCFSISENYIRMSFPKDLKKDGSNTKGGPIGSPIGGPIELTARQQEVFELIKKDNRLTKRALAEKLAINVSAAQGHLDTLKDKGVLQREGGTRGFWKIVNLDN
jgi:predicted HTH transcriptional regulator